MSGAMPAPEQRQCRPYLRSREKLRRLSQSNYQLRPWRRTLVGRRNQTQHGHLGQVALDGWDGTHSMVQYANALKIQI